MSRINARLRLVNTFSTGSLQRLITCHPDLQRLFREVIKHVDCEIVCGFRSREDQMVAYTTGHSKLPWPHSRHNSQPSMAVDVVPLPLHWNDTPTFQAFAVIVKEQASQLGIAIRWGGDYPHFKDWDHFELLETAAR